MFQALRHRAVHYVVLIAAAAMLTLPHLGRTSLWDDDEALNAEAAREMMESGDWVVPTFNFRLRDAKPALLYWCQIAAYRAFGVSEFAARLPSALACIAVGLLTYELGRRMFKSSVGLFAAIMLLSSVLVVWLGNFATPDMLLLAATILTFLCFWSGYSPDAPDQSPRDRWHVPVGLACGIGMLAKGPVAVVLPAATITAFLLWQRQARQLWNRRTLLGIAACAAVCTPWYLAVTVATRGAFASGFFLHNNMQRLYAPMEMHGGSFLYPSLALFAGFAPWSAFLLWMAASATKSFFTRKHDSANNCAATESSDFQSSPINKAPARLLICWSTAYLLVFSFSATKLPHYTAPVVPALAILLAQFLAQWCRRECSIPRWLVFFAAALIIIGGSLSVAIVGGAVRIPLFDEARGNMLHWALVASPVAILAIGLTWCARHGLRRGGVITLAACHVVTILLFASGVAPAFNRVKPICSLVNDASLNRPNDDIRIGSLLYTQPSVVFYSRREVKQLHDVFEAAEFLESPLPAYLLVAESHWNCVEPFLKDATTVICARCYDPFRRRHILVVSNQPDATALATASHDLD